MRRDLKWILTGKAGEPKEPVFSTAQKVGVAAGLVLNPLFLIPALYPSVVRKTVQIVSAETARHEKPVASNRARQLLGA